MADAAMEDASRGALASSKGEERSGRGREKGEVEEDGKYVPDDREPPARDKDRRRSTREDEGARGRDSDRRDRDREREKDGDRERERDRVRRDERRDDRYDDRRGREERRDRDGGRDRDREREKDREREREKDRDRDRDRAREKEKERPRLNEEVRTSDKRRRDEDGDEHDNGRRDEGKEKGEISAPMTTVPMPVYLPPPEVPKTKGQPISIEDLIKQRAAVHAANSRPVFMSKAMRQKMEEETKQKAEEEAKSLREEETKTREAFIAAQKEKERKEREDARRRDWDREKEREQLREREREERDKNNSKSAVSSHDNSAAHKGGRAPPSHSDLVEKAKQLEVQAIKQEKLGLKKEKKKPVKQSDKFKVQFNWDAADDTTQLANPLAAAQPELRPLFGRGFIAGIDKKEQLKKLHEDGHTARRMGQLTHTERDAVEQHWSEKTLEKMSERDWRIFREDFNISTRGGSIPNPLRSWQESSLHEDILKAVEKMGYEKPSPIQRQSIPIGLQGRDILGVAETGSGKTAAFVIPMLVYISRLPKMTLENAGDGPYALILAPTRELVQQIEAEVTKLAQFMNLRAVAIVGGVSIEQQGFSLRHGVEIIIATPGRLVDCIDQRYIVLNQCNYVVLDEADRMIDLGFEPQVLKILEAMPSTALKSENEEEAARQEALGGPRVYRTTHLYSATMPVSVERLARKYLRRPAYVAIGEVGKAVDRIEQRVEFCKSDMDKRKALMNLLRTGPSPPIMIFVNTKKTGDGVAKALDREGYKATAIHSGKSQEQREAAMEGFRTNRFDILVATDVAGRGIDVKGITHVINFDMPPTIADYTHRIGRTGRAGLSGLATSLITNDDSEIFYDLKQMLTATGNAVPPELGKHPAAQTKPGPANTSRSDTVIFANQG